jgi:dipeptidyl aminopeptidase/acylaminoacyl peptidase
VYIRDIHIDDAHNRYFFNNYFKYFNDSNLTHRTYSCYRYKSKQVKISNGGDFAIRTFAGRDSKFDGKDDYSVMTGGKPRKRNSIQKIYNGELSGNLCHSSDKKYFGNEGIGIGLFDISYDDKFLVTVNDDNRRLMSYYDIDSGKVVKSVESKNGKIQSVQFLPDGKGVIYITNRTKNPINVWSVVTGQTFKIQIPAHNIYFSRIYEISYDGRYVLFMDYPDLKLLDMRTGSVMKINKFFIKHGKKVIGKTAISRNNKYVLFSVDRNLYFIDVVKEKLELLSSNLKIDAIEFDKNNKYFLTGVSRKRDTSIYKWTIID